MLATASTPRKIGERWDGEMKRMVIQFVILLTCASCNPLQVLGPRDKPDFQHRDWTAVSMTYWLSTATGSVKRTFTVTNAVGIAELKGRMNVKKVSGLSVGVDDQLILVERGGTQWQGNVVFEDAIYLCQTKDKWYSYRIDLQDDGLFAVLMNLCLQNERQFHGKVGAENIMLRRNLSKEYPPVNE